MKLEFKFVWKGNVYKVDMIDFVNKTVAFRMPIENSDKWEGGFVEVSEGQLLDFNGKEILL